MNNQTLIMLESYSLKLEIYFLNLEDLDMFLVDEIDFEFINKSIIYLFSLDILISNYYKL